MGAIVSCHASPPRTTSSRNAASAQSTLGKVGQLPSTTPSHSGDITTHSSTLPYKRGGANESISSPVVNPLDPQRDIYPIEDHTKMALQMKDVSVIAAPGAASGVHSAVNAAAAPSHPALCATSPMHRPPLNGRKTSRGGARDVPQQRTLAGNAAAAAAAGTALSTFADHTDNNGSHSRLDISGPFMGNSRRESSLTDITMDDDVSSSMHASISGNFRHSTGAGGFPYRGEDLELQRQQAPLSIEEDLFIYDDIVISKDEARTKHWRLAGRKPALQLDSLATPAGGKSAGEGGSGSHGGSPSASTAAAKKLSTSGTYKFFSFNDFDVCVDEMDFSITRATGEQAGALLPTMDGAPASPLSPAHGGAGDEEVSTVASLGSGACGASFYAKLTERVSVMSTVPTIHNTGAAAEARVYESGSHTNRVLKDFTYDTIIGHATRVKCIALCPNEKDYASCSNEDASITLCNLGVRDEVGIFTGHIDTVINATFSPDGKYLATTSKDKTMILWDVMTTKKILTFSHAKVVICCCFAPDSKYLVSGCQDRVCRLWDTRRGKEWLSYTQHDGIIIAIAFSPDGNYVCSASADKTLRVWSTSTAKTRFTLTGHTGIILACSYTNDGKHIISNDETSLRVWNTEDGSCKLSLSPAQVAGSTHLTAKGPKLGWTLSCAAPGAFTDYLLVACNNRFVYVVDLNTGNEVHSVFCKAPVYCLAAGTKDLTACGDSFGNIYVLHLK